MNAFYIEIPDRIHFMRALLHLATCHGHHIEVHFDAQTIFGSQLAMNCIAELLDPEHRILTLVPTAPIQSERGSTPLEA